MSLGATTSAPASTCDTAVRASSSSALVVVHLAVDDHAAVAVRRVLAEADVGRSARARGSAAGARAARAARCRRPPRRRSPARPSPPGCRRGSPPARRAGRAPRPRGRRRRRVQRDMPGSSSFRERLRRDEERHHELVEREPRLAHERRAAAPLRRKRRRRTSGYGARRASKSTAQPRAGARGPSAQRTAPMPASQAVWMPSARHGLVS